VNYSFELIHELTFLSPEEITSASEDIIMKNRDLDLLHVPTPTVKTFWPNGFSEINISFQNDCIGLLNRNHSHFKWICASECLQSL